MKTLKHNRENSETKLRKLMINKNTTTVIYTNS